MNTNFIAFILAAEIFETESPTEYIDIQVSDRYCISPKFLEEVNEQFNGILSEAICHYSLFFRKQHVTIDDIKKSKLNIEQWSAKDFRRYAEQKYPNHSPVKSFYLENDLDKDI